MLLVDANIVLRYLLWDNKHQAEISKDYLENKEIYILNEVIAEIVYVLEGVYKVKRNEIKGSLIKLIDYPNIKIDNKVVTKSALEIFAENKIDFVDAILVGYKKEMNAKVFSFDKKLKKILH